MRKTIIDADGKPGTNNNTADNSGNGGKGGTIKNADPCAKGYSAKGGDGGSGNKGKNSGNGGKGGTISF
jgi:hypothetical protein